MTLYKVTYDHFKREDNTNNINILLYKDDQTPIVPDKSHTWNAKIVSGADYVGEYPVTIAGNVITLSTARLTNLPYGDYGLELWETSGNSRTLYPSAGMIKFTIHRNAEDGVKEADFTSGIHAILDDMHNEIGTLDEKVTADKADLQGQFTTLQGKHNTDVNTLQGGINSNKAAISKAQSAADKAQSDLSSARTQLGDRITKAQTAADNAQKSSDGVNTKVDKLRTDFDGLEIGGRNLLQESGFVVYDPSTFEQKWQRGGNTSWAFSTEKPDSDSLAQSLKVTINGSGNAVGLRYLNPNVKKDAVYTFSCWMKSSTDDVNLQLESAGEKNSVFSLTTDWKYYSGQVNFKVDGRTLYLYPKNSMAGDFLIYHPKLEKGTKATDWTPAPEDTDVTINAAQTTADKANNTATNLTKKYDWQTKTGAIDLNDIKTTSRIWYQDTQAKNGPDAGYFYLEVDAIGTSKVKQTLYKDSDASKIWHRVFSTSSWSEWVLQANQSDLTELQSQIDTLKETVQKLEKQSSSTTN